MRTFLRAGIREERWLRDDYPWLASGQVPADAMRDLATKGNTLSVFEVDDDEIDARYVVAAWWAAGDHNDRPADVGFATFDIDSVQRLGLKVARTAGRTAAHDVDVLHVNIEELSAGRLAELAAIIAQGATDVVLRRELVTLIERSLDDRRFDRERVNPRLLERFNA